MNNDLISRGALLENYGLKNAVKYGNETAEQQHNSYSTLMLYEIAEMINDAPAVDAEPVRHAIWRQKKMNVPKGKGQTYLMWGCSSCHNHEKKRSPYCPNCGAKMDGGNANAAD